MDLLFNFRTSFYNDEQDEIIGNNEMFFYYLKRPFFILDVFSTLPFDMISESGNTSAMAILKFLKLIRLLRLTRILSKVKNEGI